MRGYKYRERGKNYLSYRTHTRKIHKMIFPLESGLSFENNSTMKIDNFFHLPCVSLRAIALERMIITSNYPKLSYLDGVCTGTHIYFLQRKHQHLPTSQIPESAATNPALNSRFTRTPTCPTSVLLGYPWIAALNTFKI